MIQIKCACLAMWLLWCTAAAAHGMLWSRVPGAALHSTSSGTSGDRDVVFEVLPTEVCRYDELSIKMSHAPNASSDVLICVQREHSDFLYVHRVPTASPAATEAYGQDTQSAAIRCVLNEDDCIPKTDSLAVKNIPGGAFPYSLVVRFSQETNRPPLSSTYDVLNALDFQPHLTGL